MSTFAEAAEGHDWLTIQALWKRYSGTAYPVFCAAMQAAVTCEQYKEAAKIHQRLWSTYPEPAFPVAYSIGMKVFGQLNDTQQVKKLWQVARDQKLVNQYVAGSRIDAAAMLGELHGKQ